MNTSKRIAIAAVSVILIAVIIWAVHSRNVTGTQAAETPALNQPAAAAVAVVQRSPAETSITIPGVFQAYQDILVHAEVSGYIKHIFVDIGDRVHTGEVLAILEVPELNAQVKAAAATLSTDRFELQRAKNDIARAKAIHFALHFEYTRLKNAAAAEPGLIAQQELDDAQSKDLSSEARIDAAESTYDAARDKLDQDQANLERYQAMQAYSYVRAPFDGVVTFRFADTGALIAAGTGESKEAMPIVRLAQSDLLRLRMPVPSSDADYMQIGGPAVVQVQDTGEIIHTKIVRFTRSLDTDTRTMLTEVDVPNKDLHLDPGMYANTTFSLRHASNALVVPIDSIVEGDQPYVLLVNKEDRVVRQPVVLGVQGPNYYQIQSGVHVGDRVIVGTLSDYEPGQKVTPSPADINLTTFTQTSQMSRNKRTTQSPSPANGGQR